MALQIIPKSCMIPVKLHNKGGIYSIKLSIIEIVGNGHLGLLFSFCDENLKPYQLTIAITQRRVMHLSCSHTGFNVLSTEYDVSGAFNNSCPVTLSVDCNTITGQVTCHFLDADLKYSVQLWPVKFEEDISFYTPINDFYLVLYSHRLQKLQFDILKILSTP